MRGRAPHLWASATILLGNLCYMTGLCDHFPRCHRSRWSWLFLDLRTSVGHCKTLWTCLEPWWLVSEPGIRIWGDLCKPYILVIFGRCTWTRWESPRHRPTRAWDTFHLLDVTITSTQDALLCLLSGQRRFWKERTRIYGHANKRSGLAERRV